MSALFQSIFKHIREIGVIFTLKAIKLQHIFKTITQDGAKTADNISCH